MTLMQDLCFWSFQRLPRLVQSALKLLGLKRLTQKWDPRNDPNYAYPLRGALAGHRMRFRQPEDFQFLNGQYEPDVCTVIAQLIRPGWVCADIGAHIGYTTLLMAKLVGPYGRVFAFEAVPENAKLLTQNVELNGYQWRVIGENCAVADVSQEAVILYAGPSSFEATTISRGWQTMIEVPAVSLDDYFSSGERLDFIKIDIEGGEVRAVLGMLRLLSETHPLVLLEIHDVGYPVVDKLMAIGYTLYDLTLSPIDVKAMHGRMNHCVAAPIGRPLLSNSSFD